MLFLAVFCGFLAENKREHIVEKQRARQYARSLVHDLGEDIRMVRVIITQMQNHIVVIDSLSAYIRGRSLGQMRNIDLFVLGSLDRYRPYKWSRATTEQLIHSGSLRYFSDPELVNQVSSYVAFTYHLDEDFAGDEERANSTATRRHEVIDMNYPSHFIYGLRNNRDSALQTEFYRTLHDTDRTPLLATDLRAVRIFLNDKLNIRRNLFIRETEELPAVVSQAEAIIALLKKRYHFN